MSRPKKRTESGRLTKESAGIIIEMLAEGAAQGKLRQACGSRLDPEVSLDDPDDQYPYQIGGLWYTNTLTYFSSGEDPRDIIGFTWEADRKEFKRRWEERYPKETESETKVETQSESEIELTYPLFAKSRTNGVIILFTSISTGICVATGEGSNSYGEFTDCWVRATNTDCWQHLTFAEAGVEFFGEKK